jgi:hypothetical protein
MKTGTARETAMICVTTAIGILAVGGSTKDGIGLIWLMLAAVIALPFVLGYRYLVTRKRVQIELSGSEQYRKLADEYRRLADIAITAVEHTDLKLGEVSAQLDHVREQQQSLHRILTEVE